DFLNSMVKRFQNTALVRELAGTRADLMELIGNSAAGFAMFDRRDRLLLWSANYAELAGCRPHELVTGMSFEEVLEAAPEVWRSPADVEERLAQYRQAGTTERLLPGGRWVRIADRPTARGGSITMPVDITDLKVREAELAAAVDEKSILMRELEHRIFNTLNTVQAIARQTRETSATPEAFAEAFESRLGALARAHQALTKGQWRAADLHTLVADTLAPFVGSDAAQ